MGKRHRDPDCDGATAENSAYSTVFVDTSLDTHFAMLVSDSDTVLDFKKKVVMEHMKCFPEFGEIKIQSLKVRRRSTFYCLPDIMLVWSAFKGTKRDWFLSVDASTALMFQNHNSCELGTSDCVKEKGADEFQSLSFDVNRVEILPMALPNNAHENNDVSGTLTGVKFDKSLGRPRDFNRNTCLEENCLETEQRAKKKQKIRQSEDVYPSLRDSCALLHASSDARNDKSNVEVTAENGNLYFDKRKEGTVALEGMTSGNFEQEAEPGQDHPTKSLGASSNAVPDQSTTPKNATGMNKDVKSDGNKWKKEKDSKMAAEVHGATHVEHGVATPSNQKSLDIGVPDLEQKGSLSPHMLNAPAAREYEFSGGGKKNRRKKKKKKKNGNEMEERKKPTDTNPGSLGMEQTVNGISGSSELVSPSIDHNPEASDEEESTLHHGGQDVQMKLDGSSKEAGDKVQGADLNGAEFVILTQNSQTLEDVTSAEKIVQKNAHISLVDGHEDFRSIVKDQINGFDQVDKNGENSENKDKRSRKKRKRVQLSSSDVKMKDADGFRGLSSDLNTMEALQVAITNDNHGKNHVWSDVKNGQLNAEAMAGTGNFDSDRRKENMKLEAMNPEIVQASKLDLDVPTESWGVSSNKVPNCIEGLVNGGGAVEDVTSKNKRKKKKSPSMIAEIQYKTDIEQTGKAENSEIRTLEEKNEEKSSLKHECEVTIPINIASSHKKDSDIAVPNPAPKESIDAHGAVEPDIFSRTKKKKKKVEMTENSSAAPNLEKSSNEQRKNGIYSGVICLSADYIPETSEKEESTLQQKEQDTQTKLFKCSSKDACEKVQGADANGVDFPVSTQIIQTLESVAAVERIVEKNIQSSTGNDHEDSAPSEKDQILGCIRLNNNGENIENKDRKAKKKRKKVQNTASNVLENLPVKVQTADVKVSTTEGNLVTLGRHGKEGMHVASSSTLSGKSEEMVDEANRAAANTSDLARTVNGGEQCKDSGNVEKKATKLNSTKGLKQVKENGIPTISTSIELQNSFKSSENQESEQQSRVRKTSFRRQGGSTQNSQQDEVVRNSSRTSPTTSDIEVKDSTPSEMGQRKTLEKPDEIHVASCYPKEKNASLKKSSLGKSESFPGSQGNRKAQTGVNAVNRMVMKTPRKKSLLSKQGSIFQDNSGESSGDENGNVCSEFSAHSPSDSSSLSSDSESVGERDVSQDLTRNGLSDAIDQSAGVKNAAILDLSDSKEMTMEMILRSSKRFKKAKLQASQNELEGNDSQPIEFALDSQSIEVVPESHPN